MSTYYVDATAGAWNGRTGLDKTGNEWLGASGFQKAVDTAGANDTIYVKASADIDLVKLLTVSHDAWSGTALTQGEACTWAGGGAGVVSETNAGASGTVVIERTAGSNPADNEVITGTTSGNTITVDATASVVKVGGIDFDTNAGSATTGYIKYVGLNSSWVNDETRVVFKGDDSDPDRIWTRTTAQQYLYFENFELKDSGDDGMGSVAGTYPDNDIFYNIHFNSNTGDGCGGPLREDGGVFINCHANNNGGNGFSTLYNYSQMHFCSAYGNSGWGFGHNTTWAAPLVGCLAHANATCGFRIYGTRQTALISCVADGHIGTNDIGIWVDAGTAIIFGCRVTGNYEGVAIDISSNGYVGMMGHCYLPDTGQDRVNTTDFPDQTPSYMGTDPTNADGNNELAGTDTDAGYNAPDTDDFNLVAAATKRSIELDFGW